MGYSIKKVAEITGLPTHTLRYYEKEGLIPFIKRDDNGNRVYDEKNLSWLELIICLRKTDIALSDLRDIVELSKEGDETIPQRKQILENHKLKMMEKQKELDRAFNKINEKIEYFGHLEKEHKGRFAKAVPAVVVGKRIDEVKVDRLAGSSSTPDGFNDAIEQIKEQAKI